MATFGTTGSGGTANLTTIGDWVGGAGITPTNAGEVTSFDVFVNGGGVTVGLLVVSGGIAGDPEGGTVLHYQNYAVPASSFGWVNVPVSAAFNLPPDTLVHLILVGDATQEMFTRLDNTDASSLTSSYIIQSPPSTAGTAPASPIGATGAVSASGDPLRIRVNYTEATGTTPIPGVRAAPVAFKTVVQPTGTNVGVKVYKGTLRDSATVVLPYELRAIDINGNLPAIDLSATTVLVGDNIFVRVQSEGGADSFTREMLAEDIA